MSEHRCSRWCAQHAAIGGPLDDEVTPDRPGDRDQQQAAEQPPPPATASEWARYWGDPERQGAAASSPGLFTVTTYTAPYQPTCMEDHSTARENSCPANEPCAHFIAAVGATIAGQRVALAAACAEEAARWREKIEAVEALLRRLTTDHPDVTQDAPTAPSEPP